MALDTLTAKANVGAGTDTLAGHNTAAGFAAAGVLITPDGLDLSNTNHLPVAAEQMIDVAGFSAVGSSVLDVFFNAPIVGTGVTYNQGAGSLNIVAGTSTNAEFLARSVRSYTGSMRLRSSHILSQRIVNNNFALLLADLLIEGAAYNIISSTQVNVTWTAHGYTSQMVGQFVLLGGITGAAGVPGRYAIASIVDANTIQFTVAGWPASGTGTLTLFGRNYLRHLFTGTAAANMNWDVQRNGWATGDTVASINTTASPGVVLMSELTGREAFLSDKLRISSLNPNISTRASRDENIPDQSVPLFVFLWSFNGATAPASSTTWTLGHVAVEMFPNQTTYVQGIRAQGGINPLPVNVQNSPSIGGIIAGTNLIGDVGIQFRANATGAGTVTNVASPATPAGALIKSGAGRLLAINLCNTSTGVRWVKFFNATAVTPGTTSAQFERPIAVGGSLEWSSDGGLGFSTGMMIMVTAARGLTDNTATGLALGDVSGFTVHA